MQNLILSGDTSTQSTKQSIYTVDCESIDSGLGILNNFLSKRINLSHCSAIIFSEEIAKESITNEINSLINNIEIRPNSNILISSKEALDVLENVSNSGENFSSRYYEFIINSSNYTGYASSSILSDVFFSINNKYSSEATATYITVTDDIIQNTGIAVFKKGRYVGNLTAPESIAHFLVTNKFGTSNISIEDPFDSKAIMDINVESAYSNTKVFLINNTPYIKTNINIKGKIKSANSDFDYSSDEAISIIEHHTNRYLESLVSQYLYKISREYDSDICHFGEMLSTRYLTIEELRKVHWDNVFKDSVFDVSVKSDINYSYLYNKELR